MAQEDHSCAMGLQDIPKMIYCHISIPDHLWYKIHLYYSTQIVGNEVVTRAISRDEFQSDKGV
jgi:hypothetical protein